VTHEAQARKRVALDFSASLSAAIARLGGVVPPEAWADRVSVESVDGTRELSPVVSAFTRVSWPADLVFASGDPESEYGFGVTEMLENLAEGFTGPLVAIASSESQHFLVVRIDDTSADPLVYRIDHDGSDSLEGGEKLSAVLRGTSKTSTRASSKVGPQLIDAIRGLDAPRAIEIVKREGRRAVAPIDRSGFTPLHYACMAGMTDVVTALLAAGADPNAELSSPMKIGVRFTKGRWSGGREAVKGEVPLQSAMMTSPRPLRWTHDTVGVVRALLAAGASVNAPEVYGRTLLQRATTLPRTDTPVVEALLAAGADPHHMSLTGGCTLASSLVFGVDRARLLLAAGVDPNRVTPSQCGPVRGATAIHVAAWNGLAPVLTLLLEAGGDPNVRAGDGTLPLACARGAAVEVLRARGAVER
jgi:ankyrin repeat protein